MAIQLWNSSTGILERTIEDQSGEVDPYAIYSVAFSPDGRLLASGSRYGVPLWDLATGKLKDFLEGNLGPIESVAISPDGRLLASGCSSTSATMNNPGVEIWDLTTGELQQTLGGHLYDVSSVSFSPNNQLLASGSLDRTVRIWDTATSSVQKAFPEALQGHRDLV